MSKSTGIILLALYLLLAGLLLITNVRVEFANFIQGALAIGAAIFLVLGK